MDYFPHDSDAMADDKLLTLRMDMGLEAVAVYWAVLEKIYHDEAPLNLDGTNVGYRLVLLLLGMDFERFSTYVKRMEELGLLYRVEGTEEYMSERAQVQIDELNRKRETARQNGKSGGRKPRENKRRNQSGTKVGSKVGSKSVPTSGDIKTETKTETKKGAAGGAGADKAAPPSAPTCPECGAQMGGTNSSRCGKALYICPECFEEVYR